MDFLSVFSSIPPIALIVLVAIVGIILFEVVVLLRRHKKPPLTPLENFSTTAAPPAASFSATPAPTGTPTATSQASSTPSTKRKINKKAIVAGLTVVIVAAAVPTSVRLMLQRQEVRSRALEQPKQVQNPADSFNVGLDPNTTQLAGSICSYDGQQPSGTVLFYNTQSKEILSQAVSVGSASFAANIDAGTYAVFFRPDSSSLPIYAHTKGSMCKFDSAYQCDDHGFLLEQVNPGEKIGGISLCDAQYNANGLPSLLKR